MTRHFVFILLVAVLAVGVTQFGSLQEKTGAGRFLSGVAATLYDILSPPPSLFIAEEPGTPMTIDGAAITVRLLRTPEEQGIGLGGRERLRRDEGALYMYPRSDFYAHSMKGMFFPLDIIWISEDKKIVDAIAGVVPESYPNDRFVNDFLAHYVLEVNAGFFDKHKLKLGDPVEFSFEEIGSPTLQ
ncbi:MAG: DUF192 domain-containing protein [Parcubacteria group bacterium]|nr:DUF192 domain-containing protein [Parcubacteria group bacterium]MBI2048956.1 DUF192 domain-containing protein [Parcubacteria group bacterium]